MSRRLLGRWFGFCLAAALAVAGPASAQLAIGIEAPPDTVRPGEAMNVEVTASNTGVGAVANVSIQLVLPAQMTAINQNFASAGGTCTGSGNLNVNCDQGETVTWNLGTLGAGARKTVSIPAYVPGSGFSPPNGTVLTLTSRVLEGATVRATAVETATVQNAPSFDVAVDELVDPVAPDANLPYTISFSNVTAANALGTTLSFTLPAGTGFVSASGGGVFAAGVVTWNLGTLLAGQGGTREVVVSVPALAGEGSLLRPVAQIQAATLITARAAPITVVQSDTPLRLEIEQGPNPVRNGEVYEVLVTATNVGGATIDPVLELRIDQATSAIAQNYATGGAVCTVSGTLNTNCDPSERMQWDLPPLAAGERVSVSMPFVVPGSGFSPPNGNLIALRGELFEPLVGQAGESRLARQTLRVHYARVFELALDESDDPVAPGASLNYTASFGNLAAASVAGVTLSVPVPAGASFVSATHGGVFAGGVVSWDLGTLAAGQGGTRQFTATVGAGVAEGELLRTVAQIQDGVSSARAPSVAVVQSGSPLRLELETGPNPVSNGEATEVLVTVTNVSGSTLDPLLELRLDEAFSAIAQNYLTRDGVCTVSGTLNTNCDPSERVRWDLAPVAPGERITVSLPWYVPGSGFSPPNGTLIPIRAEVSDPVVGATAESRYVRQQLRVHYARTLEVALDESDDPVAPGAPLTYVASFSNIGAVAATGATLSVPLPAGTSFVSASDGGTLSAGVVTWNLGTIAAGQGGTREFTVNVDALSTGEVLRTVAQLQDSVGNSARGTSAAVVQAGSPLRLEIEPALNPARNGETIEVLVTVSNVGGATLSPRLELRLDQVNGAFSQNYMTGGGICTPSGTGNTNCDASERVQWNLTPLAAGQRTTVSLPITVPGSGFSPPNGALIPIRAELYEVQAGATSDSRLARQQLRVHYARTLEIALDESDDPVAPGASLTYTATYANVSAASATGTTLSVPVPAGTTFVSATGGGTLSSGVVTWNLGMLPASQSGTRQFTVTVGAGAPEGELLRTHALLRDAAGNQARVPSVAVVQAGSPLRLEIESEFNPARNGQSADVQLTVTNVSASTFDPLLLLRLDEYFSALPQNFLTRGGVCTISGAVNTNCDASELVQWDLAPLAPGERITVSLPWFVPGSGFSPPNGTLLPVRAEVAEQVPGSTPRARFARTQLAVQYTPTFELTLDESLDPIAPNADLTYTLTLGKVSAQVSALGVITFQVPAGTSFVSATGGGTHSNGLVTWLLLPLPAGQTGTRQVTVHVGPGLAQGTLVRALAQVSDAAGYSARARAVTAVQTGALAPLRLLLTAAPDPARPGNVLDVDLQVSNLSAGTISGAVLETRVPGYVFAFAQGVAAGADCTVSGTGNTNCDLQERVRFAVPDLGPGASTTFSMPPTVATSGFAPPNGELIRLVAWVDSGAAQSAAKETVRVGFLDSDGDGLLDTFDNCGAVANPGQEDGDADESGDLCDYCPTLGNADQSDVDADLVGDVCDNCVTLANPRVSATYLTTNPWATLTGGQRDDDHDGYGNVCDAKFPGVSGTLVNANDTAQIRASIGKSRTGDTCGTLGTRPCAIFDLDEALGTLGAGDTVRFRQLLGKIVGPKCAACPLPCAAGTTGTCF